MFNDVLVSTNKPRTLWQTVADELRALAERFDPTLRTVEDVRLRDLAAAEYALHLALAEKERRDHTVAMLRARVARLRRAGTYHSTAPVPSGSDEGTA